MHPYNSVREFHDVYGLTSEHTPNLPDFTTPEGRALRELRMRLVREEFEEYIGAEQTNDILEIAKELSDLVYVAVGTAIAYGIPFVLAIRCLFHLAFERPTMSR